MFDVDTDKARAAWEMEGSTNWIEDNVDATNGFSFEVRSCRKASAGFPSAAVAVAAAQPARHATASAHTHQETLSLQPGLTPCDPFARLHLGQRSFRQGPLFFHPIPAGHPPALLPSPRCTLLTPPHPTPRSCRAPTRAPWTMV